VSSDYGSGKRRIRVGSAAAFLVVLATCGDSEGPTAQEDLPLEPADSPHLPSRGFHKGFASVLPPDGDFEAAYARAAAHGDFVGTWVGDAGTGYWNLGSVLEGAWGQQFVEELTRNKGMFPIINLSFMDRDPATGNLVLLSPPGEGYTGLADPAFREAYLQGAMEAVRASRPLYLSLGNEVNRWWEQYGSESGDPMGFQHFVSLYQEVYDAVKAISPDTRVFCVFAREVVAANREAALIPLEMFDPGRLDLLALTSYPFAVQGVNQSSDLPDDYYSRLVQRPGFQGKPVAFTELGWSTLEAFGGEEEQARFLEDVVGRLTTGQGLNLRLLGWFSLYDLPSDLHGTGLLDISGREKEAFAVWGEL